MSDVLDIARKIVADEAARDSFPDERPTWSKERLLLARALLAAVEGPVTDNDRDTVIEECAQVAHAHREKGPWYGTELVVWRRACAQVEDAIRALSKDRDVGKRDHKEK